ncbi:AI-2E family transporter [Candidatus Uhrbacteria bacterium]|nr:AI-2E family transporter [Candidatus Uhrbacteria bacterium]
MQTKPLQQAFFLTALAGVLLLTAYIFLPYAVTIAVSATFAVTLYPFYKRVLALVRGHGSIASALTVLTAIVLILIPLTILLWQVFTEARDAYVVIRDNRDSYLHLVEDVILQPIKTYIPQFESNTDRYLEEALGTLTSQLADIFSGTVQTVISLFLGLISLYYFLKDGERFVASLVSLSPLADKYDHKIFERMAQAVHSVLRGQLLIACIQGLMTGVGFWIFGIPNPFLWGSVGALCGLVPGVGTALVLVPGIVYLFVTGQTLPAVGMTIWGSVAVGLIDNLLGPTLIGQSAKIHPMLVLFGVIGGILFFGPMGFLLGPLTVSLLLALLDVYRMLILRTRD